MLASRTEEPQEMTIEYLNVINDLFTFYHQSVSRILKVGVSSLTCAVDDKCSCISWPGEIGISLLSTWRRSLPPSLHWSATCLSSFQQFFILYPTLSYQRFVYVDHCSYVLTTLTCIITNTATIPTQSQTR